MMPRISQIPLESWGAEAVEAINNLYLWRDNVSKKIESLDQRIRKLEDRQKLKDQQQPRNWR